MKGMMPYIISVLMQQFASPNNVKLANITLLPLALVPGVMKADES
jgi:hypothetical protein